MKKIPTQMFKKIIGMCGVLLLVQSAQAQFTFPVYEPFSEYPEGDRIGKNTSSQDPFNDPVVYANWNTGNSMNTNASPLVSTNYALSYPGLSPDPNSPHKGIMGATGAGRSTAAPFTPQTSGTNYLSFLLNIQSLPTAARPIIGEVESATISSASGSSGVSVWVTPSGQLQFDVHNSATPLTNTTSALSVSNTYFIVLAYVFTNNVTTNTGEVDLWVNPTSLGNDANIPAPTIFTTNSNPGNQVGGPLSSPPTLQGLCLIYGTGQGGSVISTNLFDELRVDNHWAGVTPTGPSPGPTFNLTGGGTGCPGDAFAVGLSGSVTTNIYWLYINSAFSGQTVTGTGSSISFGPQSVSGVYTVVASNTVSGNVGWMNGNVSVLVLAGPNITTQPASVVVATNGYATFSVTATGNGLNYQWYKNGTGLSDGGHVSGTKTNTLVISPATTADAATAANGYYVIITNSCGLAATSTPIAALTLGAPANLVWQGGNPNTNWDLATTANWTNSAGSAVVFNEGDNVTFNDSSTNQIVTLVGALAPTSINETAAKNYSINGSGSIAGSASLLMSGSGILTNSTANSYTGGTTISNGRVIVNDSGQMALGVGIVTLAGGTLEMGLKSGSALVGLSNINVTASSTLQIDGTSSYAFVILNALTGSPGATLTIYDKWDTSATPDRIRLYGIFTNNGPIAITSLGNEVEIAPYNTTNGYQVYNGVISGSGGRFVPRGNGSVIFNGANTFNDSSVDNNGNGPSGYSVLLSSGNVGVGADSVSSSPPAIDSSPLGTGILGIKVGNEGGTCSLFASGGAHTVANPIAYTSATNTATLTLSGSNNLTLAGSFTLSGADGTGNTNRTINVNNTALTTISGVISDAGLGCGIIKIGSRTLVLSATNTYTGPTTVSNGTLLVNGQIHTNTVTVAGGTLGGSGTVLGPVTVSSGGTLAPGTSAIGTLTISNSLTLNGNLFFKVNKSLSPSQSNDIAVVTGTLTSSGIGTLTVTNAGPTALVVGDKFKLFSKAVASGSTLGVSGGGVLWTNNLQVDGSISVTSLTVPTPVINSVILQDNGTNLVFSGTNGTADGAYSVLSSTNLTTPLANWVLQASGTFNGIGGFSYTNVIGVPVRFFILRIP
jgi:autotransporter-associated beta strand protein